MTENVFAENVLIEIYQYVLAEVLIGREYIGIGEASTTSLSVSSCFIKFAESAGPLAVRSRCTSSLHASHVHNILFSIIAISGLCYGAYPIFYYCYQRLLMFAPLLRHVSDTSPTTKGNYGHASNLSSWICVRMSSASCLSPGWVLVAPRWLLV